MTHLCFGVEGKEEGRIEEIPRVTGLGWFWSVVPFGELLQVLFKVCPTKDPVTRPPLPICPPDVLVVLLHPLKLELSLDLVDR